MKSSNARIYYRISTKPPATSIVESLPLRCPLGFGASCQPRSGIAYLSPLCTTIKPASPLSLSRLLCCPHLQRPSRFVAVQSYPSVSLSPQPRARCANHLFSETSVTTLVRLRSYLDPHRCGGLLCLFAHSSITPSSSAARPPG